VPQAAYDLVVIGAGTGGYVAAIRAGQLGLKTAVVERQKALGGTCLIWGCIPTKALLEHAHALKIVQHAADWGVGIGGAQPTLDLKTVHARQDKIVTGLTKGVETLFKKNGVTWVKGTARLAGGGTVVVTGGDDQEITAKHILVATGSAPRSVPGVTVDRQRVITSDEAIHLPEVPKTIAVLGSGAVGVEFASIFNRFGSKVTIIELLPRLVPNEDEAVSTELQRSFRKQGITVLTGTKVSRAEVKGSSVTLSAELPGGKNETIEADYLLVATGRGPVTDGLDLEKIGVELHKGYVKVDSLFRTNVEGISAVGDMITFGEGTRHPQLAHVSSAEGILVSERVAGQDVRPIDYDHVPSCTYCDPEIGSVGLTEQAAKDRGYDVRVGSFPFRALGRARIADETDGFVKIVADRKYDEILGVHIIGPRATELVAEGVLALRTECTVEELVHTIHAHPTMSEAVGEAAHATHGAAIHI
jgi:dihydrolipoamide dehydrogenase